MEVPEVVDHTLEPASNDEVPVVVNGPAQNQFYRVLPSAFGQSFIAFNNIPIISGNRAYLDNFELEITAQIVFRQNVTPHAEPGMVKPLYASLLTPWLSPGEWTFDSFPFNKACEQVVVNLNGAAITSHPMYYMRPYERYFNMEALTKKYASICPIQKPLGQNESGMIYAPSKLLDMLKIRQLYRDNVDPESNVQTPGITFGRSFPTRLGINQTGLTQNAGGVIGNYNNSIVRLGQPLIASQATERMDNYNMLLPYGVGKWSPGYENYYVNEDGDIVVTVTWREPILAAPFLSQLNRDKGQAIYNISSLSMNFSLANLPGMIRACQLRYIEFNGGRIVSPLADYTVTLQKTVLCYQVVTLPPTIKKPDLMVLQTTRFDYFTTDITDGSNVPRPIPIEGEKVRISSAQYTLKTVPRAIWIYCAPVLNDYHVNYAERYIPDTTSEATNAMLREDMLQCKNQWDTNKMFAFLENISISWGNTTQILSTAQAADLFRIAKNNGCRDNFISWGVYDPLDTSAAMEKSLIEVAGAGSFDAVKPHLGPFGVGSVLRLIPGVDIINPYSNIIPGTDAKKTVFQVDAVFNIPPHSVPYSHYALWLLFEYNDIYNLRTGSCLMTSIELERDKSGKETLALKRPRKD